MRSSSDFYIAPGATSAKRRPHSRRARSAPQATRHKQRAAAFQAKGVESSFSAFPRFGDALRDRGNGRVVEIKETADLLQGLRVDTDQVDQLTIKSGTSVHGKSRISKRGNGEVRKGL